MLSEFSSLRTLSTLSPVPGLIPWLKNTLLPLLRASIDSDISLTLSHPCVQFMFQHDDYLDLVLRELPDDNSHKWLGSRIKSAHHALILCISTILSIKNSNRWHESERLQILLRPMLTSMVVHYLAVEKISGKDGMALPLGKYFCNLLGSNYILFCALWDCFSI